MGDDTLFDMAQKKAFRLLTVRPRSIKELRSKLKEKGFDEFIVDNVIERLLELKYLDDGAFAKEWARSLAVNRLWGDKRIKISLREKGIIGELADQSIAYAREEIQEREAVKKIIEKKYGKNSVSDINLEIDSSKAKRRLIQNLMGRGFPPGLIFDVLGKSKEDYADDRE
ncbi:MAG: regulatory protein RecX [Deltaproteobacteria bacterium]|nr:regulatory protein RecX [Deltaproteobacteria bacterium]